MAEVTHDGGAHVQPRAGSPHNNERNPPAKPPNPILAGLMMMMWGACFITAPKTLKQLIRSVQGPWQ